MKSLYLVCCTLAAFGALSQGQISPCDFPEICFPAKPSIEDANDLQGQILHARCYSACVEDVVPKVLNLTASTDVVLPTLPCWPSARLPELSGSIANWCSYGCTPALSGLPCPHPICLLLQMQLQIQDDMFLTICNMGCPVGAQLRNESGNPPSNPIAPPVPTSFSPVHFDFTSAQPNTSHCEANITIRNTFVVRMSNGIIDATSWLVSSADWAKPYKPFSCKYVNVSFAVVNRYGASELSPAVTMCGGGIVYPSAVQNLSFILDGDREKSKEFDHDVVKILLSWKPPPEADLATGYRVTVVSTGRSSHCPDEKKPAEFIIPKDSNGITLESNQSTGFKLPLQCKFLIKLESLPQIPDNLLKSWQQSTEIDVVTDYLGPSSKVVGVRVTPGVSNTSPTLTVTWQALAEGNVTYTVKYSTQPGEVNTPPEGAFEVMGISSNSTILTALERGTTYYIWVVGVAEEGEGQHSDRTSGVTYGNATHPTNGSLSVVTLNEAGKVKVTWSTPTLGPGQVITGYSVQYRRKGTISYTTRSVSGSNTTSYTITNLNLGTVYEVRVASLGPLGLSGYCCGSGKQVTTFNRSKLPIAVTAVPGVNLGSIRVTWVAPLDTGGVPITGYYIQYRIRSSASYDIQLSQPHPTEATISGLRLGTTYQVRLAALTAIGIGPYCCTQNGSQVFARTRDVPAKVSRVSAVPGVRSGRPIIRVTWSPPKSDKPISKYHLQYRKATASSWTAITLAPSETSTVLSGLDRGTVYHVQVRAVSVVGSGPFSDRQQVTTHNVPSFITALSVSPTESAHRPALSVSWSPPQSDLPILHYTVTYSLRDSGAVTNITTTSTRVLIPNLSIGATYQVAVTAKSALGEGPRSVWVHQTTFSLPRQVTGVTLSRVVRSGAPALRVTWTTPQSDTAITHYRVRHRKSGMKDWTSRTVSGSPPPTVTTYLEGLSLGTAYEVQLQAESAIGPGNFSEVQIATAFDVPASVPEASFAITPTVIGGRSSLSVQWRPPLSDLPILGYTVTVEVSSSVGGRGREVTTTSTSLIVENLAIGTTYTIHLKARSAVGFGAEVQKLANTLDVLPPDEVHSYPLPQRGTFRVTWTVAPNSTHGLTLTGYSVQYKEEGGDKYQSQQVTEVPSPGELETFELEGLELGTTYELRVAVVTLSGVGKYSDVINVTTYADCCSECSSIQSTMFVSFEVGSMKVDESDSLVHIDVFRYGPMSDPITLRVTDIPLTAKRVEDYSLQSSSLVFLNTERMVERSTVVVRIREDSIPEQDPPTESFRLVLSSSAAGGGMQPAVVFSVPEMEVHIRDNDY